MNRKNGPTQGDDPAAAATEAALAQLKPRVDPSLADDVKRRLRANWSEEASSEETVTLSLERYVRGAQRSAAVIGLLVGLVVGIVLGAGGALALMLTSDLVESPTEKVYVLPLTYSELLSKDPRALSPAERSFLEHHEEMHRDNP